MVALIFPAFLITFLTTDSGTHASLLIFSTTDIGAPSKDAKSCTMESNRFAMLCSEFLCEFCFKSVALRAILGDEFPCRVLLKFLGVLGILGNDVRRMWYGCMGCVCVVWMYGMYGMYVCGMCVNCCVYCVWNVCGV